MSHTGQKQARRGSWKLAAVVVCMFGFGFALVPLYGAICQLTGLNGRNAGLLVKADVPERADPKRTVKVQFLTTVNGGRVWSFAAEQQQLGQLATAADRVQWGYIKDADLRARFAPLVQNLSQVGLVFVLLVGGWMVIHDHLPVASIVSFNLYLVMMQAPFMMLGMLIMMGQRASASAARIYEILDEAQAIKNAETRRAQAGQRLKAHFRVALTGTPIENYLDELWSLFNVINPGLLGSREG